MVTTDTAWINRLYFRGQDILRRISPTDEANGLIKNQADATYFWDKNAVKFGAAYIYSLSQQLPNGYSREFGRQTPFKRLQDFRREPLDRYTEVDLNASYSREFFNDLIAKDQAFLGTIGINHYRFSNGQFWNSGEGPVDSTTELMARLAYIGLGKTGGPLNWSVTPSVEWDHDFDGFEGDFLQFNIDADIVVPNWKLRFSPHVGVGYDFDYTGEGNGWNHVETSLAISRPIAQNVTLNVFGGYNFDLGVSSGGQSRADSGFFGGVSFSIGGLSELVASAPEPAAGGKGIEPAAPAERKRWSLSLGESYRQIDAAFRSKSIDAFEALDLIHRKPGGGDTRFAGDTGAHYLNGNVGPAGLVPGTSKFTGGRTLGSEAELNRQSVYSAQRFGYREEQTTRPAASDDSDELLSPYLKLSYDLIDSPSFAMGVGLQYAFAKGSMDSGIAPVSLSRGYEKISNYGYIYDHDEHFGPFAGDALITNPDKYADFILGFGDPDSADIARGRKPQSTEEVIENEVVRVAGFLRSKLDIEMHEITAPLSLTFKPNRRFEFALSVGPTLNVFDTDIDSELSFQTLPNLSSGRTLKRDLSFQSRSLLSSGSGLAGQSASASSAPSSAAAGATAPTSKPSGGKGALDTHEPSLPGRTVARRTASSSEQHLTWGVMGQGTVTVYLDDAQRWYFELWGRYNYVNPFTVSNSMTSAEIDASSWSAGAGLGFRF